jgi:hypothetical protein
MNYTPLGNQCLLQICLQNYIDLDTKSIYLDFTVRYRLTGFQRRYDYWRETKEGFQENSKVLKDNFCECNNFRGLGQQYLMSSTSIIPALRVY